MKKLISKITALIILITLSSCANTQKANWSEHLEAGQKYLLDGNYEQAIIEFNKAIEIEPRNVDAYLGLADVYVAQGDYEKAIEVLEKGYAETESSKIQSKINELKGITSVQTGVTEQTKAPSTGAITLSESDPVAEDFAWTFENGVLTISGHGRMPHYYTGTSVPWYDRHEEIKEVIIENGITNIGFSAFLDCTSLVSITIPDSVTSIKWSAFCNCDSLTRITTPDNIIRIVGNLFTSCNNLTKIINYSNEYCVVNDVLFTKDMTKIISFPAGIQSDCYNIPYSVTSIERSAFDGCNNLTDITIPDSVTSIGDHAFYNCASLTGITIPDSVTSIEWNAFNGCVNLISITIPNSVTSIGDDTFSGCDSLTSVTIPESVTSMGRHAFSGCSSLTDIYCEAAAKPARWDDEWLGYCSATVHWGYKG